MKTIILYEDLNKSLSALSKITVSRGQLPILANVLLEADKSGLTMTATNLELGLRIYAGGKVEEEGSITVPAKSLSEFVGSLASSASIEFFSEGERLRVKSGKYEAVFASISASEFPLVPRSGESENKKIKLRKDDMRDISVQVAYAAASDESRPVLTGVRFNKNTITATDGFRLARLSLDLEDMGELILPARTILELARMIELDGGAEIGMEIVKENNQVIFSYGQAELVSRVLEGNFPDVNKIIPVSFGTELILDREELVRSIKAVGVFARENNNIIKFIVHDSEFIVKAVAKESGEGEVGIEIEKEGDDVEIAFNFRYVSEFLNSIKGERVTLKLGGSMAPGVWGEENNEKLIVLIMPVRI